MVCVESLCDGQQRRARRESVAATAGRARAIGLRSGQSLGGNATAFGYSVTITASFGAVELGRGTPRFGDLVVFGLGAVVAFGGLEGLATGGFRSPLQKGSNDVVLLGTALAFISIVLAIATARGLPSCSVARGRGLARRSARRWCSRSLRAWSSCLPNGCRNAAASPLSLTGSPGPPGSATSRDQPDHRPDDRRQSHCFAQPASVNYRPQPGAT